MREADYDAYDLDDPKHPDWEDLAAERADLERKREKEDAAEAMSRAGRQGPLLADQRTQGFPLSRAERKPVSDRGKRAWVFLGLACFFAGMWILVEQAQAHNLPGTEHNRRHAITHAFCLSLKPCPMGEKAIDVAYCESGPKLWPWAHNGEHLGMFQVSGHWRATVPGWGWGPWQQARHAYRVWHLVGWGHWDCA